MDRTSKSARDRRTNALRGRGMRRPRGRSGLLRALNLGGIMSFKIDIKENIMEAYNAFDKLKRSEVSKAARRAINRTLVTIRKESVIEIKKDLRIKSSVLKNQYIWIEKPRGKGLKDLGGAVVYQSKGLALIDFLRGTKAVTQQKGIPAKRRKKVRVEITPGKKFIVKGGFITQTVSKGLQIMKKGKDRSHLMMQTAPALGTLLLNDKKKIGARLQAKGAQTFQENFSRELNYRLQNLFKPKNK